jgi:hypothetical protein
VGGEYDRDPSPNAWIWRTLLRRGADAVATQGDTGLVRSRPVREDGSMHSIRAHRGTRRPEPAIGLSYALTGISLTWRADRHRKGA